MDKAPVSSGLLEERVAMYLQAIEYATAANDDNRRQDLERDIQTLMDLMEQVNMGQVVMANQVPPPLQLRTHAGEPLANPLGELSARLADYHKALYFADIEIGENRTPQIQTLQRGLQVIQKLQEKAQAGYPIRPEDIPPPVTIPTDDEFVTDPKNVITERIPLFYQAIEMAKQEGKKTRVQTLEAGIQKLNYLLQRAEANIPIYKKDLPCPPALGQKFRQQTEEYRRTVELLTKMSGLSARAAKLAAARGDAEMEAQLRNNAKALTEVLHDYEMGKPLDMSTCPYSLADIERLADQAGVPATRQIQDTETVRLRINQYKLSALKAKRAGQVDLALKHMKVVKGLQPLLQAAEKGETIDVTQVPPPPSEQTPTTEQAARELTETAEPATENHAFESETELDGKSLAEELSAFLEEVPSLDNSPSLKRPSVMRFTDSPTKSTSNSNQEKNLTDSPPTKLASSLNQEKNRPHNRAPEISIQPAQVPPSVNSTPLKFPLSSRSNDDGKTFISRSPLPSQPEQFASHPPNQRSAGLVDVRQTGQVSSQGMKQNIGLDLTQSTHDPSQGMNRNAGMMDRTQNLQNSSKGVVSSGHSHHVEDYTHGVKISGHTQNIQNSSQGDKNLGHPQTLTGQLQQVQNMQTSTVMSNGSHGNGSPERFQGQRQQVTEVRMEDRNRGQGQAPLSLMTNGFNSQNKNSPVVTCIEILKYERLLLDRDGSGDARQASERLAQQMEEEKQRLRAGGYEAWLAYLGQVEEDVGNINNSMKQARQLGQETILSSLIIKKELAERELALMRKRLPELQD